MMQGHLWRVEYKPLAQAEASQKEPVLTTSKYTSFRQFSRRGSKRVTPKSQRAAKFQLRKDSKLVKKTPSEVRLEAGFNVLQALAQRVKPQINYASSNTSDPLTVENDVSSSVQQQIPSQDQEVQLAPQDEIVEEINEEERDRLRNEAILTSRKKRAMYRRASSFEKKLAVTFHKIQEKHVSKMQDVKELMQEYNQWAFDSKFQQDLEELSTYELHKSIKQFQRQSLKNIAQNLNQLNSEIDNQKLTNKLKFPVRAQPLPRLYIKLQPCEMKQESLSESNLSELSTPDEVSQIKKEKMNYMSTKTQVRKMSDQEDRSSSCFSDAYSSLTRKDSQANKKKVLISQTSIKGICKNIRKLTQDLIQSENSTVLNDTDYVSVEKDSPAFSGEKKFKPTHKVPCPLPYSSQEVVKATDACKKQINQEYDRQYHSNHDQKNPSFLQKPELFQKLNTTHEFNPLTFFQTNRDYQKPKHQHSEFFSKVLAYQLGFDGSTPDKFSGKDTFNFEGSSFQVEANQENIKPAPTIYRKSTQDDYCKMSFIGCDRVPQTNYNSNNSNAFAEQARRK